MFWCYSVSVLFRVCCIWYWSTMVNLAELYTQFRVSQLTHVSLVTSSIVISSSSKVCPLYGGFPSPKTKFRHLSLSLVSSSVSPWFVMLRLTPFIRFSLGLPLLRVPSGSHSKMFSGSLFPSILFTCPNNRSRFSSVTSKMTYVLLNRQIHTTISVYHNLYIQCSTCFEFIELIIRNCVWTITKPAYS
jgi:hypothetical protein